MAKWKLSDLKTAYIVIGTTGEHADRTEWPVRVFTDKDKAENYILRLEYIWRSFSDQPHTGRGFQRSNMKRLERALYELDPDFEEDYTGTYWYLYECPLDLI